MYYRYIEFVYILSYRSGKNVGGKNNVKVAREMVEAKMYMMYMYICLCVLCVCLCVCVCVLGYGCVSRLKYVYNILMNN